MKSNLIKCPETGEILLYDKLFEGERIAVSSEQIKHYDLAPTSGVVKGLDGTLIDITKKILVKSGSTDDHHHDNKYAKLDHTHNEYALTQNVYAKEDVFNHRRKDVKAYCLHLRCRCAPYFKNTFYHVSKRKNRFCRL